MQLLREETSIVVIPSGAEKTIPVPLDIGKDFKAICYYFKENHDSYPTVKYVKNAQEIPLNTFLIIVHEADKEYSVFLCLSYQNQKSTLQGASDGLRLHLLWNEKNNQITSLHALINRNNEKLHTAIFQTMDAALKLTGGNGILPADKHPLPKWFSMLGWSSISFGNEVSQDNILNAVWSLRQNDIHLGYVIIDEGWQNVSKDLALQDFQADNTKFPEGLKGIVDKLHQAGIKHVGVWHSLIGARGGIHPGLAAKYDLRSEKDGRYILGDDLGKAFRFYNDYYDFLRQQGVDFVQVGDQIRANRWPEGYKNLQTAIQAAAGTHFSTSPLNTECLGNENIFYWSNSPIAKSAGKVNIVDDKDVKISIRNHLINSLWLGSIMSPDIDSWSTIGPVNEMLAAFHAVSGSINILNDLPGEHNKNLIRRMVLPSGKIVQADQPLTVCAECAFVDPLESNQLYKAYTRTRQHGVIAAFNLSSDSKTVRGSVSLADLNGLQAERYVIFSFHHGFSGFLNTGEEEELPISLKANQYDILIFAPLSNGIAVWGFPQLYLASGPLLEIDLEEDSAHITTDVSGQLILYCEKQILEVRKNGHVIPWEYDDDTYMLTIDPKANLVENHSAYSILFES